jgi:hypothetical protein
MSYTKTFTLLSPWAESIPWECLVRPTNCISEDHKHQPMVGQPCAVPDCDEPLLENETCSMVVEVEGYVCWRHVRPDKGPISIVPSTNEEGERDER